MKKIKHIISLTILLSILMPIASFGQTSPCNTDPNKNSSVIPSLGWEQNSLVEVNIDSSKFTPEEYACIKNLFDSFNLQNGATQGNGTGVFFSLGYSTNTLAQGNPASGPPQRTQYGSNFSNVYEITKDSNSDGYGDTGGGESNGSHITAAVTLIDDRIDNCPALRETLAHEIAHTFGLQHCGGNQYCGNNQNSIMQIPPCPQDANGRCSAASVNTPHGLPLLPTPCDKEKLHDAGYDPNTVDQPDVGGGDGGGDGGDGQTCITEIIPGQTWEVCVETSWDTWDAYWGAWIVNIDSSCEIYSDPGSTEEICY